MITNSRFKNTGLSKDNIRKHVLLACGIGTLCFSGASARAADAVWQLESRFIKERRSIQSAKITFASQFRTYLRNPSREGVLQRRTVYIEGDSIRCDTSSNVFVKQHVFTPDVEIINSEPTQHVEVYSPPASNTKPLETPDPLLFGIAVWYSDSINTRGLEEFFLNPNRTNLKSEECTYNGEPAVKVTFEVPGPVFGEYVVSKARGGFPVYCRYYAWEGEQAYARSIDVALKSYGPTGVWYPEEVIFKIETGGKLAVEEVVSIEEAVFNENLENQFSLAGLGLAEGRLVAVGRELKVWDGSRLVDKLHFTSATTAKGRKRSIFFSMFAFFLLCCVLLVMLKRSRGRSA